MNLQNIKFFFEEFDNNPNIKKVAVVDIVSIIELLKKGRIDAFVMPKQSAEKYLEQNDSEQLISSAEFVHKVKQGGYVALSKNSGHQDKVKALNKAMKQLKDSGQLKQILAKYKLSL